MCIWTFSIVTNTTFRKQSAFETSWLCNQWRWKKSKYISVISRTLHHCLRITVYSFNVVLRSRVVFLSISSSVKNVKFESVAGAEGWFLTFWVMVLHNVVYKSNPITGLCRPLGFHKVEAPRISTESAHEGGKFVSPTHRPRLPPRKYSW
jgi:hypothetical protein